MRNHNPFDSEKKTIAKPLWIIAILFSTIFIFASLDNIISRAGWGPDDQLRMVQIRDFLNGQSWFDWTQYRMNVPDGAPMHWSRLIELPITFLIFVFTPIFDQDIAEMIAGAIVPLAGLTITSYIIGRISLSLWNYQAAIFAILLTWINPATSFQFRPMRIDHHGWQIMLASLALWTMLWPSKKHGGIILGLALATWLHISLEGLPITAAFFILLGWRWIIEKAHGQRLIWTIASFTITSFSLYIVTQGLPFNAPAYCDSISPPYLTAIAAAAIIMLVSINSNINNRFMRVAMAAFAGATAIAILIYLAPECSGGAFAQLDPLVYQYWYINVSEGLPIWHQQLHPALLVSALPLIAIIALFIFVPKFGSGLRSKLYMIGYFTIYAALLSCFVFRTVTVASAFAIPLVAMWLSQIFHNYKRSPYPLKRISLVIVMLFLAIAGPIASTIASFIIPKEEEQLQNRNNKAQNNDQPRCKSAAGLKSLQSLPSPSNILTPFNLGTLILLNSNHHVIASSHHRNEDAMHDQIAIMIANPNNALKLIQERKISYIVTCPTSQEWEYYHSKHANSLAAAIMNGKTPSWLEPVPNQDNLKIWRVVQ